MVQRRLLGLENPEQPTAEMQQHLADCASCQDWQRRLLQMEKNIGLIPVPESSFRREVFLERLEQATVPFRERVKQTSQWLRRRAYPLAGVAAALLVCVTVWWANRETPVAPVKKSAVAGKDLVTRLLDRDLKLAKAKTSQERVQELSNLAEELRGETRILATAADPGDLMKLAKLYGKVIDEGIIQRASALPEQERAKVLKPIADKLEKAGKEADELARQVPQAAGSLELIAMAARRGNDKLTSLLAEEKGGTQ
jgi:hypothetical protein